MPKCAGQIPNAEVRMPNLEYLEFGNWHSEFEARGVLVINHAKYRMALSLTWANAEVTIQAFAFDAARPQQADPRTPQQAGTARSAPRVVPTR